MPRRHGEGAMPGAGVAEEALIVFTPSGRRGRFPFGTPVLQAARALGVDIDSVCGGRGHSGPCPVALPPGEFPTPRAAPPPPHPTPPPPVPRPPAPPNPPLP